MTSEPAISVRNLRKVYGDLEAVAGIDLEVRTGEVFALLGPNGAGKTTTVEILEGHRTRTSGEVSVLGFDPEHGGSKFRERLGIVLQETGIERFLTVSEVIEMFRGYYPHPLPLDEVLELSGLTPQRDTMVRKLSGGQQRRLDVAVGIAGDPDLLFLDEPTTGFDPAARRNAWQMIRSLKGLGKTVVLTTHYMEEAQTLADRLAIIAAGKIVAEGTPAELIATDPASTIRFRLKTEEPLPPPLAEQLHLSDGMALMRTTNPTASLYEVLRWAHERGVELEELSLSRPSLEDVYLRLVGALPEEAEEA